MLLHHDLKSNSENSGLCSVPNRKKEKEVGDKSLT